ncbi:hypothetical protein [Halothiobacillus neapolitanus]|uniref:Uncharacterized protein n=1 Tax=Halothiobacillus neapolitanus (strain ATCC 23641 / DSM 15147 / CIP 104769 / NCIMB 8539 / c2) TaxID=555778 RepID=D0KWE9_HALNC|nr:hypothetical protein [Halothiobacillus neapolitanus]ACX94946.1 conserved hypothetical protein [Halothiobacillus neapolitanus c2]TDN57327.1 hypothetical protein C8D83_1174 [Halothiobacillus neapolitanus]
MKQKEIDRWAKARTKGMLMYVLLTGIVSYGIPMFAVMTFLFHHSKLSVVQSAALWLAAGAFYGIATWLVQEHRYRKATDVPQV